MAETVSFKVCLKNYGENSDVRRFAMDRELSKNFSSLLEKLTIIFPSFAKKTFAVTWTDEENDSVTISSDEELAIALAEMSGPVYKLNVQVTGEKKAAGGSNTEGVSHPGVFCDGCDKDLVGFRYKCLGCPDFDLCGACESAGLHPEHRMIRIARPDQKFSPNFGRRMCGKPRNFRQRPCHVPVQGVFGFLEGLEKMAGGQTNFGSCSRGEKPNKETVKDAKKTPEKDEVKTENEGKKKENGEKTTTEKMVKNFLEAAVGCLGDDVQAPAKDIENVGKLVSDIVSMFNIEVHTEEQNEEPKDKTKEQETPTEARNDVEPEKEKTPTSDADEDEWTIVKEDSNTQVTSSNMYPSLDEAALAPSTEASSSLPSHTTTTTNASVPSSTAAVASSSPDTTSVSTPSLPSAPVTTPSLPAAPVTTPSLPAAPVTTPSLPTAPANVTDPKILVALQAMTNMGFTNEGGWLQNLLEAKDGDIGKVLDVLKPNNK